MVASASTYKPYSFSGWYYLCLMSCLPEPSTVDNVLVTQFLLTGSFINVTETGYGSIHLQHLELLWLFP